MDLVFTQVSHTPYPALEYRALELLARAVIMVKGRWNCRKILWMFLS